MTMLSKLEDAIKELEKQKDELLEKIQESGWSDDRSHEKIPEHREFNPDMEEAFEAMKGRIIPEKSRLPPTIRQIYQQWYSAARAIINRNQPERLSEFDDAYSSIKTPTKRDILDELSLSEARIKDILKNRHLSKYEQFQLMDLITAQFEILAAIPSHLKFSMYDIELTAYSVLMDDEIEAARYLLKNGFRRAGGALAGVSLERHLKVLLDKHSPPLKYKAKATLADLNNTCKETVYDFVIWRKVQHLSDLRNLCDHDKGREPKKEEVRELIDGVASIIKMNNPSGKI